MQALGSALLVVLFLSGQDGRTWSSADSVPLMAGRVPSLGLRQRGDVADVAGPADERRVGDLQ